MPVRPSGSPLLTSPEGCVRETRSAFCRVRRQLWLDPGGRTPGTRLGGRLPQDRTDWPQPRLRADCGLSTPTKPTCQVPAQAGRGRVRKHRDKQRASHTQDNTLALFHLGGGLSLGPRLCRSHRGNLVGPPWRNNIRYTCNWHPR